MPRITVIVPVYKTELYIHRCVDSILCQTFSDFDLILIDDGSPDHCGRICDEYRKADSRIHVIHNKKNRGLSAARNAGIAWAMKHSDSRWITFVDSDDWIHPLYLEALYTAAQDCGISVCFRSKTHGEELPVTTSFTIRHLSPEDYYMTYMGNSTVAWAKLYAKNLFKNIRYPVGKLHEDQFVTYKLLFQFDTIPFIEEQLYAHYLNPNGIMLSPWTPGKLDVLAALEEQVDFFSSKGCTALAQNRLQSLQKNNKEGQALLGSYEGISGMKRKHMMNKLRRQQQRLGQGDVSH